MYNLTMLNAIIKARVVVELGNAIHTIATMIPVIISMHWAICIGNLKRVSKYFVNSIFRCWRRVTERNELLDGSFGK